MNRKYRIKWSKSAVKPYQQQLNVKRAEIVILRGDVGKAEQAIKDSTTMYEAAIEELARSEADNNTIENVRTKLDKEYSKEQTKLSQALNEATNRLTMWQGKLDSWLNNLPFPVYKLA